jgi:hypothetical protein
MYVPKTVYENAPYFWVALGVLLIVFGAFYGKAGNLEYLIAGVGGGTFACAWGLIVFKRRLAQESRKPCATYDEYLDQTMELDLRSGPLASRQSPAEPPAPEQ